MHSRFTSHVSFASARLVVIFVAALALAACDRSITGPGTLRNRGASDGIVRDDTPPDDVCRSGWTLVSGHWTCGDSMGG